MARLFNYATPDFLHTNTAVVTVPPLTISCWIYPGDVTTDQAIVSIQNNGADDLILAALFLRSTGIRAYTRLATVGQSVGAGQLSLNQWYHVAGVWYSTASRNAFVDNIAGTANTTSLSPTGINSTSIGQFGDSSPSFRFNGRIAEVAIWNVALADTEIGALSRKAHPLHVRRANLVAYWPLWGIDSPEIPLVGGSFTLGINGTPVRANHAPVGLFSMRNRPRSPIEEIAAAGSSAAAGQYYRRLLA